MVGAAGAQSEEFADKEDVVGELESEIADTLSTFDDDPRLQLDPDLLLKAVVRYAI
jgi:hypothetical protein